MWRPGVCLQSYHLVTIPARHSAATVVLWYCDHCHEARQVNRAGLMQQTQEHIGHRNQAIVPASLACVSCSRGIVRWPLSEVITLPVYGILGNSNGWPVSVNPQMRCYAAAALVQLSIAVHHDHLQAAGAFACAHASKEPLIGEASIYRSMECTMVWVPPVAARRLLRPVAAALCTRAVPGMPGSLVCRAHWGLYASEGAERMLPTLKQHPAQQVWPQLGPLLQHPNG